MVDKKAFFKLSYGLYILSSRIGEKDAACVINTLQQVTGDPARLSIAVNKENFTCKAIEKSGVFAAGVLLSQADMDLIRGFGFRSSQDHDKFSAYNYKRDENGVIYLMEQTAARFSCKVRNSLDVESHVIYIGDVVESEILSEAEPMTYAYYHTVKKGLTPPKAPSYQDSSNQKGWRCSICGYIHPDAVPEDFRCPICGAPAELFERISG